MELVNGHLPAMTTAWCFKPWALCLWSAHALEVVQFLMMIMANCPIYRAFPFAMFCSTVSAIESIALMGPLLDLLSLSSVAQFALGVCSFCSGFHALWHQCSLVLDACPFVLQFSLLPIPFQESRSLRSLSPVVGLLTPNTMGHLMRKYFSVPKSHVSQRFCSTSTCWCIGSLWFWALVKKTYLSWLTFFVDLLFVAFIFPSKCGKDVQRVILHNSK